MSKKVLGKIWEEVKGFLFIILTFLLVGIFVVGGVFAWKTCETPAEAMIETPAYGEPVKTGSGWTLEVRGVNNTTEDGSIYKIATWGWPTHRANPTGTALETSLVTCIQLSPTAWAVSKFQRSYLSFDTSALPDDAFISSATVRLHYTGRIVAAPCYLTPRLVLTGSTIQNWAGVDGGEMAEFLDERFCTSVPCDAFPPHYIYFELNEAGKAYINRTGITGFALRDYIFDALNNDPTYEGQSGSWQLSATCDTLENADINKRPLLTIVYGDTPIDREETQNPDNAAVGGAGNNVTDIDWKTVRCAYSDEELGFRVTGDPGTPISLKLLDGNDNVLDTHSDTIRVDGYYYWRANCGLGDQGFVRCLEDNHSVYSEWGFIAPKPDSSQIHNWTYATETNWPQYIEPFSTYIVDEDDLMVVHWKTDIQDDELDDYSFRLYHLGDSADTLYNEILADMLDTYYLNCYDENDFQVGIRYAIFMADNPGDSKDGLILDLDRTYIGANTGFYQGLIYKEGASEYSTTHSAHCYIKDLPGIEITVGDPGKIPDFDTSVPIGIIVSIDDETGGLVMWDKYQVTNYKGPAGTGTGGQMQQVNGNLSTSIFSVDGVMSGSTKDDYYLQFRFYDSTPGCTFEYIYDIPYTVGGGKLEDEEENILDKWLDWLEGLGIGTWAVIIILMVIGFLVCYQSKVLRVVVPLLIFGLGLVSGWLDIWVVILLALGAGVTLFFLIRRGHGGGS